MGGAEGRRGRPHLSTSIHVIQHTIAHENDFGKFRGACLVAFRPLRQGDVALAEEMVIPPRRWSPRLR
jgi:hypothetical protein